MSVKTILFDAKGGVWIVLAQVRRLQIFKLTPPNHHGGGGRVGDPHGQKRGGQHESQH